MKWDITVGSRFANLEGRRKLVRIIGELEKSEEKIAFDRGGDTTFGSSRRKF